MKHPMRLPAQFMRFAVVIVVGFGVDLLTGFCLANVFGVPLTVAAAVGFLLGALFNYVLHEFWTFRSAESRLSPRRASLYLLMMLVTLGSRLSVVALLSPLATNPLASLTVLVAAAGVSFVANYLLSYFVVYRRSSMLADKTTSQSVLRRP